LFSVASPRASRNSPSRASLHQKRGLSPFDVSPFDDTLKNTGYNPNSMVLLPRWNDLAGH
jgi:hypothetical protein